MASRRVDLIIEATGGKSAAKDVRGVASAVDETGRAAKRSSGASRAFRGALHAVGIGAKVGAIGVGALAVSSVKAASTFEQTISSLGSVTGAHGAALETLRSQALKAGADTAFSAQEAAVAQTELAKGGISTANILRGGLNAALGLAAAGEINLADAASYTANAMNLFGLHGARAGHVADALATAANVTTADVGDFGAALTQTGSVAKSAGLSFDDTVVALEALAQSGIKGSDAGTSLKTSLLALLKPTAKQAGVAQGLGLSFLDAQGKMKSLSGISGMLRDKLGGQTKAQRTATLATLAGTDGVRTLTSLYDAGPKALAGYQRGLDKQGTAAAVAAKKQDNFRGKLEQLSGSFDTLKIVIVTALLPVLSAAAEKATGLVNGVTDIASAATAASGGGFMSGLMAAMETLDTKVGAKGAIVRGVYDLRAALSGLDLASVWEQAKTAISGFDLGALVGQVGGLLGPLRTFADIAMWAFNLPGAKTMLISLVAAGASFKVLNAATGGAAGGLLSFSANSMRMGIVTATLVTQILAYKTARIGMSAADNAGALTTMRSAVATGFQTAKMIVASAATRAWAAGQWLLNAAMRANPIGMVIVGLVALAAGFALAYAKVGWFRNGVNAVFGWLKSNWPLVLGILTGPVGLAVLAIVKHWGTIKSAAGSVVGFVKGRFSALVGFFSGMPGKIAGVAGGMFDGIKNAFKSAINFVIGAWNGLELKLPGVKLPGPAPDIPGVTISTPDIPTLAKGGNLRRSGPVLVGDAGPEILHPRAGAQVSPLSTPGGGPGPLLDEERLAALIGREVAAAIDGIRAVVGDEALARSTRRSGTRAALQRSTA